ncbi:MAG: ammonium transporter [Alphaproteobacteria bacterium]|nr:ammonium transporter [Alphaproteobacteria bacterium]
MDSNITALTTLFTEFYYWVTVVFMFFIHVGFCVYEVGVSRRRNHIHTLMKNTMLIPLVTITFFFFGWWIYFALPNGPLITGGINFEGAKAARPWDPAMGPNLQDHIDGVFWAAFVLFAWTAASIVSGSTIERIRSGAFWIFAVIVGSVSWVVASSWGWHPDGWMVKKLGYHDAYCSGVIHAVAGGFALGVLTVLGPRLAKFREDGTPRNIPPQNPWLANIGLFLLFAGFWGFYAACNIPIIAAEEIGGQITGVNWTATNIYYGPTTLSGITFNFLMSLSGGMLAAYLASKGNAFWTYSGGLAGLICASAGNDLYHPLQSMFIGAFGAWAAYRLHGFVERRFKIDDVVGAVAVHGYAGCLGLVIAGFMLWGQPAAPFDGYASINPLGQIAGAVIVFGLLGFLPGWASAKVLSVFGVLRVPGKMELEGLDFESQEAHDAAVDEVLSAEKTLAASGEGAGAVAK